MVGQARTMRAKREAILPDDGLFRQWPESVVRTQNHLGKKYGSTL